MDQKATLEKNSFGATKRRFNFCLHLSTGLTVKFAAESSKDRTRWIAMLNDAKAKPLEARLKR